MDKQYKIKRTRSSRHGIFRSRRKPLHFIFGIAGLAVLILIGILLYRPVVNFFASVGESEVSMPEIDTSDNTSSTESEVAQNQSSSGDESSALSTVSTSDLHMAYLPTATAADTAALNAFIAELDPNTVNTVLVDIKDSNGNVLFNAQSQQAVEWGTVTSNAYDLTAVAKALEEKGFSLAVRMSTFNDSIAAKKDIANAIEYQSSGMYWLDGNNTQWLNPYASGAQAYLTELATEAVEAGAKLVVLDSYRFPQYSSSDATFGDESTGISRTEALKTYLDELTATLEAKGARTAIYLTPALLVGDATLYGGSPLDFAGEDIVMGILPSMFSGTYGETTLTLADSLNDPGAAVKAILEYVQPLCEGHTIIPFIQGDSQTGTATAFTADQISAELDAVSDAEIKDYILYSSTGEYLLSQAD